MLKRTTKFTLFFVPLFPVSTRALPELGRSSRLGRAGLVLLGGGVKRGMSYGATDDFGHNVTTDPVDVHDFQATVLKLLGIDHERLTFKFQGRYFRLTDVHGKVVNAVLA